MSKQIVLHPYYSAMKWKELEELIHLTQHLGWIWKDLYWTSKGYILYDSMYTTFSKWRTDLWLPRLNKRGEEMAKRQPRKMGEAIKGYHVTMGKFCILTMMMVRRIYTGETYSIELYAHVHWNVCTENSEIWIRSVGLHVSSPVLMLH